MAAGASVSLSRRIVAVVVGLLAPIQVIVALVVSRFHVSCSFQPDFSCRKLGAFLTRGERGYANVSRIPTTRHHTKLKSSISNDSELSAIQLWLDLRGTAIAPQMALTKLEEESPFPVSKVLVSIQDAQQARELSGFDLMMIDSTDNTLCDAMDPTIQYGTRVGVDGDSFVDPMPALETASIGEWVLIDPTEGNDKKFQEKQEAISNLVDFISSGLSLEKGSLAFGVDATNDSSSNVVGTTSDTAGGIAIACRSKKEMVQAANMLQSLEVGTLTTTESGILLKTNPTDSSSPALQSALVLPFDLPLWKASVLVLSEVML